MRLPKLILDGGKPVIPKGYRKLEDSEIIIKGDLANFSNGWMKSVNMGDTVTRSLEFVSKGWFVYIRKIEIPKIKSE